MVTRRRRPPVAEALAATAAEGPGCSRCGITLVFHRRDADLGDLYRCPGCGLKGTLEQIRDVDK